MNEKEINMSDQEISHEPTHDTGAQPTSLILIDPRMGDDAMADAAMAWVETIKAKYAAIDAAGEPPVQQ